MPIKVDPSHGHHAVEVPTMQEFNSLLSRIQELESKALKSGDKVSLRAKNEYLTWMTQGGEVKSRGTDFIPEFQDWQIDHH